VQPAVPTITIHAECFCGKPLEAIRLKMFTEIHPLHYPCEGGEILLLATH
jgi:hypothetical protein